MMRVRYPVPIETREEYDYAVFRGFEPLIDKRFKMPIELRIEVQRAKFGAGHSPEENERFYCWCWEHLPHVCEETGKPLREYSAVYISHILTRGAHPEMAHDPRNVNILSFEKHNQWENGDREHMRIYPGNQLRIEQLKREYNKLNY